MRKKMFVISGIVLIMLMATLSISVIADQNDSQILSRTHIRAFGKFDVSEEDNVVYGKIFFGFIGLQPVFNLDIEICQDSIKWIIMSGFSINGVRTYRFLNCVISE